MKNDENLSEFAKLCPNIKPLKQKMISPYFAPPPKEKNWRKIEAQDYRSEAQFFDAVNLENIEQKRFRALTAGFLFEQREIDLHGFFVDEALRYLQDLIDQRDNIHTEIWLIIHGKGKDDIAPLKIAVWEFLQQHPAINALAPKIDSRKECGALFVEIKARSWQRLKKFY